MPTKCLPNPPVASAANLQRSLQYYQEGVLNPEAWFEIVEGDYRQLLETVNWNRLFEGSPFPLQLLDIGCGTGKFPRMLRSRLRRETPIFYDFLDPSDFSLTMCRKALAPPYRPRHAIHATFEGATLPILPSGYDIVWAIQSLYCFNQDSLPETMNTIQKTLNPHRGTALLVLAKRDAFFHLLYERFNFLFGDRQSHSYVTAESVLQALSKIGMPTIVREIDCVHTIAVRDTVRLDQYLQQCVMDRRPTKSWRGHLFMRDFLDSFRHADVYRFPNPIWVILSAPSMARGDGRLRLRSYLEPVSTPLVA